MLEWDGVPHRLRNEWMVCIYGLAQFSVHDLAFAVELRPYAIFFVHHGLSVHTPVGSGREGFIRVCLEAHIG